MGCLAGDERGTTEGARLEVQGRSLDLIAEVYEQGVAASTEAMSEPVNRGEALGKRKRGEELAHLTTRHSLWGQGSLEAHL